MATASGGFTNPGVDRCTSHQNDCISVMDLSKQPRASTTTDALHLQKKTTCKYKLNIFWHRKSYASSLTEALFQNLQTAELLCRRQILRLQASHPSGSRHVPGYMDGLGQPRRPQETARDISQRLDENNP